MGLSVALDSALSGLRLTQTGLETVSRNIANAGLEGYAKRSVVGAERHGSGVRDGQVRRALDSIVQRQLRTETAGGAYATTQAQYLRRLDEAFGAPGSAGALDTAFNALTGKMQALAAEPSNTIARRAVLDAGRSLAASLNGLSGDILDLRGDAEARIDSLAKEANAALSTIERVSIQLNTTVASNARAELLDERDRQIDRLASMMDIRVNAADGDGVTIFTSSGVSLFSGRASQIAFDARGVSSAEARYDPDPAKSTVGRLRVVDPYGAEIDVSAGGLRTGEFAALLSLRDDVLVDAQDRLDAIAAGLAKALSDRTVTGVAATAGAATGFDLDLAALQSGNAITLDVVTQPGNVAKRFSFVKVDGAASLPLPQSATANPNDSVVGVDFSGGMAGVVSAVQAALGGAFAVSNPAGQTLRILDDGAGTTSDVTALSASVTNTALSGQGTELPFFIDAGDGVAARPFTARFQNGWQQTGFASRIAINQGLVADPSRLVVSSTGTMAGDPARPALMLERLTAATQDFPGEAGGAFRGTIGDFLRQTMDVQAGRAADAAMLEEGQQVVVSSLKERFSEVSGVSIDAEMAELVALQNAYSANARIVSAVREMLETLMRI